MVLRRLNGGAVSPAARAIASNGPVVIPDRQSRSPYAKPFAADSRPTQQRRILHRGHKLQGRPRQLTERSQN
ncbi:hypothetical protein H6F67_01580 [Microcoleus sp. FACHB-1515]|uniref:hypothetical protein n=1 Tax=Cyanophyceae TaxID=3028117 RepID=UPI001682B6D1|nr:hypothetical protein [Microcoleus sp. FACHB-1515]MBD2088559.1 hypothetical protein [Microcoleus sp. FACHB-1515]